jgi:transposase-like protein
VQRRVHREGLRDELLELVRGGETVAGACRRLGVSRDTVYSWKARHPDDFGRLLSEAVQTNREGDWREAAAWLERVVPERWSLDDVLAPFRTAG